MASSSTAYQTFQTSVASIVRPRGCAVMVVAAGAPRTSSTTQHWWLRAILKATTKVKKY